MKVENKIKRITSLYESCNNCGLPTINCICNKVTTVETKAKIWILSSQKELTRASNTARILKLVNGYSTEIFTWERTNQPVDLIKKINSNEYDVYLLFPVNDENRSREVKFVKSKKTPAFIIIDGTWNEAKKIFRKSPYLNEVPMLTLKPENNSSFILRRGIEEGSLCTIETAIEVLKMNGEKREANDINSTFSLFQENYKCGLSGHIAK
ncbi:MAG: tRNA-uridine aminocarboxypropyltransferase [Clostridium sp.]